MNFKLPYTGSEIAAILEKAANGQVLSLDEKAAVQALTTELAAGGELMTPEQAEKLNGLIGFDGEVVVKYNGAPTVLLPDKAGVYKAIDASLTYRMGVLCLGRAGTPNHSVALFAEDGNIYTGSGVPGDTITLAISTGTKLYRHDIPQFYTGGGGYVISTRKARYTSLGEVISDFHHTGNYRILCARYGLMGGTRVIIDITGSSQQGQPTTKIYYFDDGNIVDQHITQSTISDSYTVAPL